MGGSICSLASGRPCINRQTAVQVIATLKPIWKGMAGFLWAVLNTSLRADCATSAEGRLKGGLSTACQQSLAAAVPSFTMMVSTM